MELNLKAAYKSICITSAAYIQLWEASAGQYELNMHLNLLERLFGPNVMIEACETKLFKNFHKLA